EVLGAHRGAAEDEHRDAEQERDALVDPGPQRGFADRGDVRLAHVEEVVEGQEPEDQDEGQDPDGGGDGQCSNFPGSRHGPGSLHPSHCRSGRCARRTIVSPRDDVRSVADTPPLPLVSLHARSPSRGAPCTSSQAADPGRGAHALRWPRPARSRRRADGARPREPAGSAVLDGVLELVLVHRRTALHVLALRILVELLLGAPLRPGMRAFATALRGRLVLDRGAARLVGLALLGAGLVHGAGGDLLRLVLGGTLVELAVLDVLVLALTLLAPC